ncbi:hypothetical protein B0H14DRAFT_3109894 [Mycena olivaceomarginata]|nr:hypothetical protein B0H14DRAFT_3109894 [Mycena olivaceomarginata]
MPRSQTLIFAGLNATRFLSIVALLLVFASSILVMVTNIKAVNRFQANRITNSTDIMLDCDYIEGSTVPNQPAGVFWAVVSSLLIIFQVIILLLSELGWPAVFFDRFFPVLGANFGLGALGIFQCLLGSQILSHRADKFPLVSAFFIFSIGCLNVLLGLIFREDAKTKRSFGGKPAASKGVIAPFVNASPQVSAVSPRSRLLAMRTQSPTPRGTYGFGRQSEKAAGLRDVAIAHPEENLPRYPSPAPSEESDPLLLNGIPPRCTPTPLPHASPAPLARRLRARTRVVRLLELAQLVRV